MKKLLSLPPNLVDCFHDITGYSRSEWFCTNDPVGHKLGSGGGSVWLLSQSERGQSSPGHQKKLLLHAGGQSRRLPAYAPSGKILTPIPVFRWERGQRLSQDLLSLQMPLYEHLMAAAPDSLSTMIVSGDVLIRATEQVGTIPEADVVCFGLWLGADIAKDHGVFVSSRHTPTQLKCMLQKPSVETLGSLQKDHYYLTDIGIWMLSDRAVDVLRQVVESRPGGSYDLYGEFGCALGTHPSLDDAAVASLSVAIVPLPGGEFYHFGTSHELLSSMLAIQNRVNDQRQIMHRDKKPHPSIFVQNAETWIRFTGENRNVWIENACVSERWTLSHENIVTGVPRNEWKIELHPGQCVDVVPIGERQWAVRPYGYDDTFRGSLLETDTQFIAQPFARWAADRRIDVAQIQGADDLQSAQLFPVVDDIGDIGLVLRWMLNEPGQQGGRMLWNESRRMSADDISAEANLRRLTEQREAFRTLNWSFLAKNHQHSVFYQLDLEDAAQEFARNNIAMPHPLSGDEPLMTRIHDAMFRAKLQELKGRPSEEYVQQAFSLLSAAISGTSRLSAPKIHAPRHADQIVWGRSPVRIDLAGGWTDTPPYCLTEGGSVVNLAVELNGQPPLQTYVKPCSEPHIVLRSIDLGASETIDTYEQLAAFRQVGSPFSIPKAALFLAGFHPESSEAPFDTLRHQLQALGCGIELTMLSAIPAGSGLGTSSILAATVLGTLSEFCGLGWDKSEIGRQTLVLEQLLTTGGGWQDQFGGLLPGVKLLQTEPVLSQQPAVRWLPTELFTQPGYQSCHLLYYTGITRTAKSILAQIVQRMFLNQHDQLALLREMKAHAVELHEAVQRNDFNRLGLLVRKTWQQNQQLDSGTNPPEVQAITRLVDDLCLGYKLPGAGGGGYLYMIAKDPDAAARVRKVLTSNSLRSNARFVDLSLSTTGLQVSRS